MNSVVTIETLENDHLGRTATATVSGAPTGALSFHAARVPDWLRASVVPQSGTNPYVLTFPHPGLWYVWAKDDNGFSREEEAVWVGVSDDPDLDATGLKLEAILRANRKGLEARLKRWYPETRIQHITYGWPGEILAFPALLITKPVKASERVGTGFLTRNTYRFEIAFMLLHANQQSELRTVVQFAQAGMEILNLPEYEEILPENKIPVVQCMASEGEHQEIDLGDLGYAAVGTLLWSGISLTQPGYTG